MRILFVIPALLAGVFAASLVIASNDATAGSVNSDPESKADNPAARKVEEAVLVGQLVDYGLQQKDPLALIVAAQIRSDSPPRSGKGS